jgi:hypothetical protein
MKELIHNREAECYEFLKAIPNNKKYVLIGGYAVSGYGFPRLSVDLDIVIPKTEFNFFDHLCQQQGYILSIERSNLDNIYAGDFKRYVKSYKLPISIDLMINSVTSRQTGSSYSVNYLFRNSTIMEIRGWHPDCKVKVRVAKKEMLIALKINSMRTADKRDIMMLCYDLPDIDKIVEHLKKCPRDIILSNLDELGILFDQKHKDSLKGVFSITDPVLKIAIKNTKKVIERIVKKI